MTTMDAIRAEVQDWSKLVDVGPSAEVLAQFYMDSLDGGTAEELAHIAIGAVASLTGKPVLARDFSQYMAVWCSGVLLGVRAAKAREQA